MKLKYTNVAHLAYSRYFATLCLAIYCAFSYAQPINFSEHIAPIIYKNCTPCHRKGEAGPFPLENYEDVKKNAKLIQYVIENKIMPPWKAERNYRSFLNERSLTNGEIFLVRSWIDSSCVKGVEHQQTKQKLEDEDVSGLGKPDLIIKVHKPYQIRSDNKDDFVTFVEKISMPHDRFLRAIKVVPGNKKLIHHCRIDLDTTKQSFADILNPDGYFETDNRDLLKNPVQNTIGAYAPGMSAFMYPNHLTSRIPMHSNILIDMHYSPTSKRQTDQTMVYFYFYKKDKQPKRNINLMSMSVDYKNEKELNIGTNLIPKNDISTVYLSIPHVNNEMSLLSIQPHMHLIGKSIKVFAIPPTGDTIPLIYIPDWNFYWQETYYFKHLIKIPVGSKIQLLAQYDNTSYNPANPNVPPKDVFFKNNMGNTIEMCEVLFRYVKYESGDEDIIISK